MASLMRPSLEMNSVYIKSAPFSLHTALNGRITYILHRRQQQRKVRQFYVSNLTIQLKICKCT
jgi:hypothetical protein